MEVIFREEWHHMGYDRNSVFTRAHQENEFPGQVENIAFIEKEIRVQPAYEKVTVIWRAIIRHKRNEINSAYSIFSLVNDLCSASASTVQCERDIKKVLKGPEIFWSEVVITKNDFNSTESLDKKNTFPKGCWNYTFFNLTWYRGSLEKIAVSVNKQMYLFFTLILIMI